MKAISTAIKKEKIGLYLITILGVLLLVIISFIEPIIQNEAYHNFSDVNTFFKLNNFWNVASNLPFLIVGFLGLYNMKLFTEKKLPYFVFFTGILLVAIGSSYYHLNPNNYTLIFDRLPMTMTFMALTSILISEFVNDKIGRKLLIPMLLLGLSSVLYWVLFKDLSFYVFIQFYPMLIIPIILICFKSSYTHSYGYWVLLALYSIAKLCEYYDNEIFDLLKIISGHSIKHIISAIGLYVLYFTYIKRKEIEINN